MLLDANQLCVSDFHGQVAAGNHHGIGGFDDRVQGFHIVGKLCPFDFRDQAGVRAGFPQ